MSDPQDPVAVLERVRELEGEIADLVRGLNPDGVSSVEVSAFQALEIGVNGADFLIPIDDVRETVRMAWPEPVAGAPEWVMGTVSYGSVPTTLIDLGLRINGRPTEVRENLLIVVVEGARWLGLVVSSVGGVRQVDASRLTTPGPEIPCANFLLGIVQRDDGDPLSVLSVRGVSRDLDG